MLAPSQLSVDKLNALSANNLGWVPTRLTPPHIIKTQRSLKQSLHDPNSHLHFPSHSKATPRARRCSSVPLKPLKATHGGMTFFTVL